MQIKEILTQLKFYNNGKFPLEALQAAVNQQEEITPHLLEIIQDCIENTAIYLSSSPAIMRHIYALFLLAQFREKQAYPLIVKLLSKNNDIPYQLFGDVITEDLPNILAAVCHNDLSLIKQLIEDESVEKFVRTSALSALLVLYLEDDLERLSIIDYLNSLFNKIKREPHVLWDELISMSMDIKAAGLMTEIQMVLDEGLLEFNDFNLKYVQDSFQQYDSNEIDNEDELKKQLLKQYNYRYPIDIINDFKKWGSFEKDVEAITYTKKEKIGRNSPCPCGSGKKFKKCCLN